MTTDQERDDRDVTEVSGTIKGPNSTQEGIVDVLSMKGLVRAIAALGRSQRKVENDGDLERALVKMINLNGALARLIQDASRR